MRAPAGTFCPQLTPADLGRFLLDAGKKCWTSVLLDAFCRHGNLEHFGYLRFRGGGHEK